MPPQWNDPTLKAGTMIRVALWLIQEVGVGNSFTKENLRTAFSGIAQADRRLRDLRTHGWVIRTSLEDVSLNSNEQRFVAAGLPVWEPGNRASNVRDVTNARIRRAILSESNYQCALCGIGGGESYPDAPRSTAVLSISRRTTAKFDGQIAEVLTSECNRCRAGTSRDAINVDDLIENVRNLQISDRQVFLRWTLSGRTGQLDQAWSEFRRLSPDIQEAVRKRLK